MKQLSLLIAALLCASFFSAGARQQNNANVIAIVGATVIGVFVYGSRGMRPPPKDADQTDPSNPDAKASGD